MNPIIILFGLSAMFLVFGIWSWRMPEKGWVNWLKADRNMLGIDYSKYNQKKIRSSNTTLLLFEAVCLFLIGLTIGKHPVLTKALCVGIVGAPIVYWFVLLVFCKKSKYRKK